MWYCLVEGVNNVKDSFTVEGDGPSVTAKWLTVSIEWLTVNCVDYLQLLRHIGVEALLVGECTHELMGLGVASLLRYLITALHRMISDKNVVK